MAESFANNQKKKPFNPMAEVEFSDDDDDLVGSTSIMAF